MTRYVSRVSIPAIVCFVFAAATPAQRQFDELIPLPAGGDITRAMALGDVDGDGDLDLVCGNDSQNRLYFNDGTGTFTDVTATRLPFGRGVGVCVGGLGWWGGCYTQEYANSVTLGDADLDGDLDIVFLNQLCLNDGTGTFTDVTASHLPSSYGSYASSVALGDVDGDGDLDFLLGRRGPYSSYCYEWEDSCGHAEQWYWWHPKPNLLYLYDQADGVLVRAPSGRLPNDSDWTTSVALGDVDDDGDLDAVIANGRWIVSAASFWGGPFAIQYAYGPNRLYLNDGTGAFTDVSGQLPSDPDWSTAVTLGDVDVDGDLDILFVSDGLRVSLNDGSGMFTDATAQCLPPIVGSCVCVALGDVDHDHDPDLVVGIDGQNWLLLNDGTGTFTDATAVRLPPDGDNTQAAVLGDADRDGDPDLVFGNAGQNRLYFNLLRHLDVPLPVALGQPYQLDAYARYGPTGVVNTAVPFISTGTASIPLPPLGTFALDPAQMIRLPAFIIQQPAGVSSTSFVVPDLPALVGVSVYAQAVIVQYPVLNRLTNWTADVIIQ